MMYNCYELFAVDFNGFLRTNAPDGRYLASSNTTCDCCDELITSNIPLVVRNGRIDRNSLLSVVRQLISCHPAFSYVEDVTWDGGGSFTIFFDV